MDDSGSTNTSEKIFSKDMTVFCMDSEESASSLGGADKSGLYVGFVVYDADGKIVCMATRCVLTSFSQL